MNSQLAWLLWDPNSVFFTLPWINIPITWYGVIFAGGFVVGYQIFIYMFSRYLAFTPNFRKDDVNWFKWEEVDHDLPKGMRRGEDESLQAVFKERPEGEDGALRSWQMRLIAFTKKHCGEAIAEKLEHRLQWENALPLFFIPIRERARLLAENGVLYVMIATILGARLGHILFYEYPLDYLKHPLSIFKTWEGGLASHGAIVAIIFSLYLFYRKSKITYPKFSFLSLMDMISVPTMFVCSMIRIGNFFNQEILGIASKKPWAIIFKNPADGSVPLPRHPAQLYESVFYFGMFLFLFLLWKKFPFKLREGKIAGIAIAGSFLFRFLIEYVKTEQSFLMEGASTTLLMGQLLSIPLMLSGVIIFFLGKKKDLQPVETSE